MKTILIVEDTQDYAENLKCFLDREGYNAVISPNGKEGVKKAIELTPDLILMDIMMPEQDGVEATRNIRIQESLKKVPVLFLTSVTGSDDVLVSVNGQNYPAMSKLINCDKMLSRIKEILQ